MRPSVAHATRSVVPWSVIILVNPLTHTSSTSSSPHPGPHGAARNLPDTTTSRLQTELDRVLVSTSKRSVSACSRGFRLGLSLGLQTERLGSSASSSELSSRLRSGGQTFGLGRSRVLSRRVSSQSREFGRLTSPKFTRNLRNARIYEINLQRS